MKKTLSFILLFVLMVSTVAAIDFVTMGDINLKNRYSLKNSLWVNGSDAYFSGNISAANFIGNLTGTSLWISILGRPTALSNFTDDLGSRGYTALSNFTDDIGAGTGGKNYTHLSNFTDNLGARGYTVLSNFTDDLGARGYTFLSNFTDDISAGTGGKNYTHLSNFTDDLGARGYAVLSNFTDDLGARGYTHLSNFTNDGVFTTYLDFIWTNITGRPTTLSNFTDDLGARGYTHLTNFTMTNLNLTGNNVTNVNYLSFQNSSGAVVWRIYVNATGSLITEAVS